MPRTRKKKLIPWTAADVRAMRTLAGKVRAKAIARTLKRTESAVWQKALALGISLRVR